MILVSRPAPALRHLIRYYYQVQAHLVCRTILQPVPARSPQAIEFTFGTPYEVHRLDHGTVEQAHSIAVIGAQTFRRVDLIMQGRVDAFTIVFQPGGLFMLFRLPGEVLTNDHFEGEAALGRGLGDLERRLGEVTSFPDRARVANEYLSANRPAVDSVSDTARAAGDVLMRSGCVRVSDLARQTGLGIRQFERRFRYEIGMPPKLYARIARFEAALRRRAAAPDRRWADIAHALGYHDQMHMVHDFNRLSGDSPTAIGSRLDMFVQPEVVSARLLE
ncbi:MAG: helix-turn-helix domain-containing protein [Acidobacteriota bacterium]